MTPAIDGFDQAERVVRGVALVGVVEEDVHVLARGVPSTDAARPLLELVVAVTAPIELGGSVQPNVNEVGGLVQRERVLAGGVGDDEGDAVATEQRERGIAEPARVPYLERVPQPAIATVGRGEHGAPGGPRVVTACATLGGGDVAR